MKANLSNIMISQCLLHVYVLTKLRIMNPLVRNWKEQGLQAIAYLDVSIITQEANKEQMKTITEYCIYYTER